MGTFPKGFPIAQVQGNSSDDYDIKKMTTKKMTKKKMTKKKMTKDKMTEKMMTMVIVGVSVQGKAFIFSIS